MSYFTFVFPMRFLNANVYLTRTVHPDIDVLLFKWLITTRD
jgi:hypothetical protein